MKKDELYSQLFGFSIPTYYNWSREKRPIINLVNKYFNVQQIEEFLKNQNIEEMVNISQSVTSDSDVNSDVIYNLIEEMKINMSKDDIVYELKKISLKKLVERLTEFPIFSRIILILDPERPSLFLYYIAQLIQVKLSKKDIKDINSYTDFFIETILELPILSIKNQPLFFNQNKKNIVENIKVKFSEENCKEIIENCKDVIELLEQKMPLRVIKAHKNKF
jgi:hypothetical protein